MLSSEDFNIIYKGNLVISSSLKIYIEFECKMWFELNYRMLNQIVLWEKKSKDILPTCIKKSIYP
jgi:hypothetical protein